MDLNMQTEAGRRIIIDRIVQEVITFLMSLGIYAYLFPEMKLSIATDRPISISYNKTDANRRVRSYTTFLTGSVDYLVLGCGATLGSDRKSTERYLLSQRTLSSLTEKDGPLDKIFSQGISNRFRLLHVEAKRDKENQKLKDYRPQAIGETLAT